MSVRGICVARVSCFGAVLLLAGPAMGQALKGTILGTVSDQSHAVILSTTVNLIEVNTNFHRTEVNNESGFYAFANRDPGTYRVNIQQTGFRETVRDGIALAANTTVRIDLELQPGDVKQVVHLTSEVPVLQTDRADTGGKVESGQLNTLPAQSAKLSEFDSTGSGRTAGLSLELALLQLPGILAGSGQWPRPAEQLHDRRTR